MGGKVGGGGSEGDEDDFDFSDCSVDEGEIEAENQADRNRLVCF